jgi:hypothetical protein
MSPLAQILPLAFAPVLFLLFVIVVVGGLAFIVYSLLGETLREKRLESGSEKEMIEGEDDGPRPVHTRVTDTAPVANAGLEHEQRAGVDAD